MSVPAPPSDTIYALSSAPGKAAVAVIRISGPATHEIGAQIAGPLPPPRSAAVRRLRAPGSDEIIDTALVICFAGPASATGEDVVEFHVHGGRAVIAAAFDMLSGFPNCRPAEAGEFARRGFENGKLDLTAAEGIADLIDADTELQRRQAQRQAGGALTRLYDQWRRQIIEAQALVEAAIDFSDEADVADDAIERARDAARSLRDDLEHHLAGATRGEIIRSGFRIVIAGPPNAGKSSLLNALARRDAAIVSEEAGTTRDVIEVHMDLDGLPVTIADTAGVRAAESGIEREGIRRTLAEAATSDLVIWLDSIDARAAPPPEMSSRRLLHATNKSDLIRPRVQPSKNGDELLLSIKEGTGVDTLIDRIIATARAAVGDAEHPVPTNARHRHHLRAARGHLQGFLSAPSAHPELGAEDLRLAATALGRLTGRIDVEDLLDQIFSRFCIGK